MTKGIEAHRKVEFVVTHSHFLTTNAKYSDIVLPVTTQWERYGYLKGNREILIWAGQVNEPLFEAKDDIWIAAELGKRLGLDSAKIDPMPLKQQVFNQVQGAKVIKDDGKTMENLVTITAADIAEMGVKGKPQTGRIPLKEFQEDGLYQVPRAPGDKLGFIALEAFRKDPVASQAEDAERQAGDPLPDLGGLCQVEGLDGDPPDPRVQQAVRGVRGYLQRLEDPREGRVSAADLHDPLPPALALHL